MTINNTDHGDRRAAARARRRAGSGRSPEAELAAAKKQIEQLRAKFFTLQEALVRSGVVDLTELNGPLSSIAPLEVRRSEGATTTVLVFAGMAMRVGMPAAEFLSVFRNRADPVNIVYVKDFRQCWYQRGLLGLSDDVRSTVDVLARETAGTRIVTLGTSAGGFAAVLFGTLLGAERMIAFGPQTVLDHRVFRRFRSLDSRWEDMAADRRFTDLQVLLAEERPAGRVEIHYAEADDTDREAAERLRDTPQVHLVAHDAEGHGIARWLRDNGKLSAILDGIGR